MVFWLDKYRPTELAAVDYHADISERLERLVQTGNFPHLLVYGPSGAGKRTRIQCTLEALYGKGASRIRIERSSFDGPSGKKLEITMRCSNYHVLLSPSDVGIYDRVVVQEVIKRMAQTQQLEVESQKRFKVIVLMEVDRLTKEAQHALRRTMEKYSSVCRLILCCQVCSKIIPPLQSRCLPIRVSAPSTGDIIKVLKKVASNEQQPLSNELARQIAEECEGNLRRAILAFESYSINPESVPKGKAIAVADWQLFVKETVNKILLEQSPKMLLEVRNRLYEMLAHCMPPTLIIRRIYFELLHSCDASLKHDLTQAAAECEYNLNKGSKPIFHLEAFVAEFMSIYKRFVEITLGSME